MLTLFSSVFVVQVELTPRGKDKISKVLNTDAPILRKRLFWILCYDLCAVTAVPSVVQQLVVGSEASFERLLRLWDLLEAMDPIPRRRIRSHIPIESQSWIHSFSLGTSLLLAFLFAP